MSEPEVDPASSSVTPAIEKMEVECKAAVPEVESKAVDMDSAVPMETDGAMLGFLARGLEAKTLGNASFKAGENEAAVTGYAIGIEVMAEWEAAKKPNTDSDDEDPPQLELDEVLVTLHLNSAMALLKLKKWTEAAAHCTLALRKQSENVKALYRRGLSRSRLNQIDGASADLTKAVRLEPTNRDAKRELAALKERITLKRNEERARFSGALARASSKGGMYRDVEEQKLKKKKAEEAAEAEKTRRFEAHNENLEEKLSMEDWEKQDKEEKKKKEERDKEEAEKTARLKYEARRLERIKENHREDKVVVDTEEELSDCRGYKTLADGRKTSYFTKVPDADTQALLTAQQTPKRIDTDDQSSPASQRHGSAWNASGTTFEERNQTSFVDEALRRHLLTTTTTTDGVWKVKIANVKKLSGEASIVVSRGKRRDIFDYTSNLEWEANFGEEEAETKEEEAETKVKGNLLLPDLSSAVTDGRYEQTVTRKKRTLDLEQEASLKEALAQLQLAVNASVANFIKEYAERVIR